MYRLLKGVYMLIRNAARCKLCGDEIESKHRHDFVTCKCGEISIDGGTAYVRCLANDFNNLIDLCEYATPNKKESN